MVDWKKLSDAIDVVCEETNKLAGEKGFNDPDRNFGELLMLVNTELSEAMECYREGFGFKLMVYDEDKGGKPEGIPSELADAFIRICAMAGYYGVPLGRAVAEKHAYNATRAYRHGGKKA